MGRAIDMENDIDVLKIEVQKLKTTVRGICSSLNEVEEVLFKEATKEKKTNGKKETNNEGNDTSSNKSNKRKADALSETSKS